jgi:hypothetical protein
MPQIPVLYVGRAVEEVFCRMLMESPALLVAKASSDTLSAIPLDENGVPSRTSLDPWPAERLLRLPNNMLPMSMDELRSWAIERLKAHLHPALKLDEERSGKRTNVKQAIGIRLTQTIVSRCALMDSICISKKSRGA